MDYKNLLAYWLFLCTEAISEYRWIMNMSSPEYKLSCFYNRKKLSHGRRHHRIALPLFSVINCDKKCWMISGKIVWESAMSNEKSIKVYLHNTSQAWQLSQVGYCGHIKTKSNYSTQTICCFYVPYNINNNIHQISKCFFLVWGNRYLTHRNFVLTCVSYPVKTQHRTNVGPM